jgi:hypothetical protein
MADDKEVAIQQPDLEVGDAEVGGVDPSMGGGDAEVGGGGKSRGRGGFWRVIKTLAYVGITLLTLCMCGFIFQYGLMILMCVILIVVGSLLWIHIEGAYSREALWSMNKEQRQQFHAKNLPFFSIVPRHAGSSSSSSTTPLPLQPAVDDEGFYAWNERAWRVVAEGISDRLTKDVSAKREFRFEVDNYVVHNGWPSPQEVADCDNTIVLSVRHSWAGLASRVNPVLNTVLNKFVKCWNRNLLYCGIRVSSYGLPFPMVILDFPTADVATLNFGQKDDCLMMDWVYKQVRKTYPTAKIILLSVCLGGLRILNWLSRHPAPENIIGVVLESPLPSVEHLLRGFLGNYFNQDLYHTFCMIVPNFRPELDNQYSFFRKLKEKKKTQEAELADRREICNIPIFLGMLDHDPFSNKTHLPLYGERFSNLTVFTSAEQYIGTHDISHGKLYRLLSYRTAVQQFLSAIRLIQVPSTPSLKSHNILKYHTTSSS